MKIKKHVSTIPQAEFFLIYQIVNIKIGNKNVQNNDKYIFPIEFTRQPVFQSIRRLQDWKLYLKYNLSEAWFRTKKQICFADYNIAQLWNSPVLYRSQIPFSSFAYNKINFYYFVPFLPGYVITNSKQT